MRGRRELTYEEVIERLREKHITILRPSWSWRRLRRAIKTWRTCAILVRACRGCHDVGHEAGISKKVLKLRPIAVIKG